MQLHKRLDVAGRMESFERTSYALTTMQAPSCQRGTSVGTNGVIRLVRARLASVAHAVRLKASPIWFRAM
jgi:hypothetical protein